MTGRQPHRDYIPAPTLRSRLRNLPGDLALTAAIVGLAYGLAEGLARLVVSG